MNYKQAEQRLKELLFTGFMVEVNYDYDTSLEVEKLFHKLYESDETLFKVEEVFEEGLFFEEDGINYFGLSAGCWGYFGINELGQTEISDTPELSTINEVELREIVEALTSDKSYPNENEKYRSKVTGVVYTLDGLVNKTKEVDGNIEVTEVALLKTSTDTVHVPLKNLHKCFDLAVEVKPEPYYIPTTLTTVESRFEAVSGDQSLFDLVEATDEHLYMILNKRHTGIYAITQEEKDSSYYNDSVVLAERKLKEPEFIPYHTENYPHEDCKGGVMAFRSRSGETAINFEEECGRGEVVLSFENTIKLANELIAIANGVERKDYK